MTIKELRTYIKDLDDDIEILFMNDNIDISIFESTRYIQIAGDDENYLIIGINGLKIDDDRNYLFL